MGGSEFGPIQKHKIGVRDGMGFYIEQLRGRFAGLEERWGAGLAGAPDVGLYRVVGAGGCSFGESLVRSAAAVEQAFGGLTSQLWDDPFEWTLPEQLSTKHRIAEYLAEVAAARDRGFAFLKSDDDLQRDIATPDGMMSIFSLLLQCLLSAEKHHARAVMCLELSPPHAGPAE